ncbi:MAG: hypothetical protein MZV70_77335 [Desulfobacterales bacterium]|nr:hypothetical protein [Desulfobacterales bacterium]
MTEEQRERPCVGVPGGDAAAEVAAAPAEPDTRMRRSPEDGDCPGRSWTHGFSQTSRGGNGRKRG